MTEVAGHNLPFDSSGAPANRGRAAVLNTANRFEPLHVELDPVEPDSEEAARPAARTRYFVDSSRSALAENDSPDLGFRFSINPYRGCEHGCIYCYARPSHEYLGFSAGLDFETKILVKPNLPELLAAGFRRNSWQPQTVALSGNTDCYQPVERRLEITRRCLETFLEFRNPVTIITKNHLVTRDLDVLVELAALDLVHVTLSITSLRPELTNIMEPRTSRPQRRLRAIEQLAAAGVPAGVNVAPLIPGLTDHEAPEILKEVAARGGRWAGFQIVRLPGAVAPLFLDWLKRNLPDRAEKVARRIEKIRGGRISDSRFGTRFSGEGELADMTRSLFEIARRKHGLDGKRPPADHPPLPPRRRRAAGVVLRIRATAPPRPDPLFLGSEPCICRTCSSLAGKATTPTGYPPWPLRRTEPCWPIARRAGTPGATTTKSTFSCAAAATAGAPGAPGSWSSPTATAPAATPVRWSTATAARYCSPSARTTRRSSSPAAATAGGPGPTPWRLPGR